MNSDIIFTPSEIIKATEKWGDQAFRINLPAARINPAGTVSYIDFEAKKEISPDTWEYAPLKVKIHNLTCGKVKSADDKISIKTKKVYLVFSNDSKYTLKGKIELYGKAKLIIDDNYRRLITKYIADKTDNVIKSHENKKITSTVQRDVLAEPNNKKSKKTIPIDKPIIRVEIPWDVNTKSGDNNPLYENLPNKIGIYDVSKPDKGKIPPFKLAKVDNVDVNYGNIHKFITPGSIVSGFDNMNTIMLHGYGITLQSKMESYVCVKQGTGFGTSAKITPLDEFNDMGDAIIDASTDIPVEEEISVADTKISSDDEKAFDEADDDDDL